MMAPPRSTSPALLLLLLLLLLGRSSSAATTTTTSSNCKNAAASCCCWCHPPQVQVQVQPTTPRTRRPAASKTAAAASLLVTRRRNVASSQQCAAVPAGAAAAAEQFLLKTKIDPTVIQASLRGSGELLSCAALGVIQAKRGVLSPTNVGALSQIVYNIFLPSLLMVNIAKTLSRESLSSLLPVPLCVWYQLTVGLLGSLVFLRTIGVKSDTELGREQRINMAFGNSGVLPLLFCSALFRNYPDPTVLPRAVAYISFFLMSWSPLFWTVGYGILTGGARAAGSKSTTTTLRERVSGAVGRIFSPPIMGCMAGVAIGLSSTLQNVLCATGAPLGPLWNAFVTLSAAYTPSGILVLAGSLANGPKVVGNHGQNQQQLLLKTKLAGVALSRWLFVPLATLAYLKVGLARGFVPNDPVLLFVLMLQASMPSAQNSVIILQVAGLRDAAGRIARSLLYIYLLAVFPVSILLTSYLGALGLVAAGGGGGG